MLRTGSKWALVAGVSVLLVGCGGPESADTGSEAATAPEPEVSAPADAAPADDSASDAEDTASANAAAGDAASAEAAPAAKPAAEAPPAAAKVAASAAKPASFALCAACHAVDAGAASSFGPNLHGVVGRKAGALAGYSYSPAMTGSGIVWNDATLSSFLEAPQKVVPGTRMAFGGVKDKAKRDEIIAYLASLK